MSKQTWAEVLASQSLAGGTFNNYTTAKTVLDPSALWVMPAGYLDIGRMLRLTVMGSISNIVTTPGTIDFQLKFGSVVAFDTGAIQLNATVHTTLPFVLEALLTCRAKGSGTSANLMGQGRVLGKMFTITAGQTDDAQSHIAIAVPTTAPAVGTGFDSTVANIVDFWVGFSIANSGNQVQIQQYLLESLN